VVWQQQDVGDIDRFPARVIEAADDPMPLVAATDVPLPGWSSADTFLIDDLAGTDTLAFIVLRGDRIVAEVYHDDSDSGRLYSSMSVAKTFVSTALGIAIEEGYIGSLDDPVAQYLHELLEIDGRFGDMTLRHLASMSSGLRYADGLSPWDDSNTSYYATDLRDVLLHNMTIEEAAGARFHYNNYNYQLLGLVIERAVGMPVSDYLATRLWQPMGSAHDASWSMDSEASGFEKMESGLNTTGRDLARFGRLVLNDGVRNGAPIIPAAWLSEATAFDLTNQEATYGLGWWIDPATGSIRAEGSDCQFLWLDPVEDTVIVRLGRSCGDVDWLAVFQQITTG
jgi:CubicO group peptidase (beta-lactamase class C family)